MGPEDAFRGAVGKDLGVPLRVEGRARNLEAPTRHGAQPAAFQLRAAAFPVRFGRTRRAWIRAARVLGPERSGGWRA